MKAYLLGGGGGDRGQLTFWLLTLGSWSRDIGLGIHNWVAVVACVESKDSTYILDTSTLRGLSFFPFLKNYETRPIWIWFSISVASYVHRHTSDGLYMSETDNPSSKSVKIDGKQMDKVRWIVPPKLRPFHFQIMTYYLSDANYPTDNPTQTDRL